MIKVRDKWFRMLIVVLPFLLVIYANKVYLHAGMAKILRTFVSLTCILLITEGNRFLIYRSRIQSWLKPSFRIWAVIVAGLAYTTLILAISTFIQVTFLSEKVDVTIHVKSRITINNNQIAVGLWGYSFFNAFFAFFFLLAGFETLYHYAKLRYTEREKEQLEKEKLRAELNQLKGIVNPHFLFNNLNSLSSLIGENPARAEAFLDELTKVFRYLLRNNQAELTILGQEILFIQSYYHLLQTRYGNGINLKIQVEKKYEDWLLPPLTLQLLVENAVKHNRLQKEHPLYIEIISATGNILTVRNTVFKREGVVESTGFGLQNINARYKMLNLAGVSIEKDHWYFTVTIPLIEPRADGEQVTEPELMPVSS